jgi:hypothetical protein
LIIAPASIPIQNAREIDPVDGRAPIRNRGYRLALRRSRNRGYDEPVSASQARWVLLSYRLPREPSGPRVSVWRKLRRLGAVQILDGLVALPLDSRTREQLEWIADEVVEAGGEAGIWLAEPAAAAQARGLAARMTAAVRDEYAALVAAAGEARAEAPASRRRVLQRLRRDLRRIERRDHFSATERQQARRALDELRSAVEHAA